MTPRPDPAEQDDLFRQYRTGHERAIRDALVEEHIGLAYHFAERYHGRGLEVDDLRQIALIGLVKAIDRFDPDRGVEFATYARHFIVGELRHHFRDAGWELHVPRSAKENALAVRKAVEQFRATEGRDPNVDELARVSDLSVEQVLEGLDVAATTRTRRFEAEQNSDGRAEHLHPEDVDNGFETVEQRMLLEQLLSDLEPRERRILHARFFEGRTQEEIAQEVGVSQVHISRLLRRTLDQLRESVGTLAQDQ